MATNFDNNLNRIFDIPESTELVEAQEFLPREASDTSLELTQLLDHDLKNDYNTVRTNIDELIQKGNLAIDDMLAIARSTEKARDFEVAANMIKTVVEANRELLDINKKVRDISGIKKEGTTNIKNAVFVGSTAELMKAMKDIKGSS